MTADTWISIGENKKFFACTQSFANFVTFLQNSQNFQNKMLQTLENFAVWIILQDLTKFCNYLFESMHDPKNTDL